MASDSPDLPERKAAAEIDRAGRDGRAGRIDAAEVKVYTNQDMEACDLHPVGAGSAAVFSTREPGKHTPNEDSAAVFSLGWDSAVLAVADGVGGARQGDEASALAIRSLEAALRHSWRNGRKIRNAILNAFEAANQAIMELGSGAATTFAVVEIAGNTVRPYHVGDSKILAFGQRGRMRLQTLSHAPTDYAVESGLMDEREAIQHEERHLVSNLLGSHSMRIEIGSEVVLNQRDTLIVASDGITDNLHTDEIVEQTRKGRLTAAVEELRRTCSARMEQPAADRPSKPDDMTIIAYRSCR